MDTTRPRLVAVWLVLGGIVSVQFGASIAKNLFSMVTPTTMVWLRLASSALVLLLVARPRLRGRSVTDWKSVAAYTVCLVAMNWSIYQSFSRIPIGLAVTIEFLGPLVVAAFASTGLRDLIWVVLAAVGVVLLGFSPTSVDPLGVAFALVAATAWAGYIYATQHIGRQWRGLDGLAVASTAGALGLTPVVLVIGGVGGFSDVTWTVLGIASAVGVLSSVIPYGLELQALRMLPRGMFSILLSAEPAVAALTAFVVLNERLSWVDLVAMTCVVVASVGVTWRARRGRLQPVVQP